MQPREGRLPRSSAAPASEPTNSRRPRSRFPLRAVGLGLLLLPLNAFWLIHMEMTTNQGSGTGGTSGPYPTTFSLFANVICLLVVLTALNGLATRMRPKWAFSQGELLIVYIMLTIGSCIPSVDFLDVLLPMMGHSTQHANAQNGWSSLYMQHMPSWFHVTDKEALKDWYQGNANPYTWAHLRAWLPALTAWGLFILALFGTMFCLNVIWRRQWTRHEKLSYPIIQLPMDMTDPVTPFYSRRLMWAGLLAAAGISLLNGVNVLAPSVPSIPVKIVDMAPYFTAKPWNNIGWTPISFYPFAIGLGFLLPADLLFSCWFFYFVWKAERILSSFAGWSDYSQSFPYLNEQCFGGYVGIAAIALWGLRGHLAQVLREARRPAPPDEDEHPISYRAALVGAALGFLFLVGFFVKAGLSIWTALASFLIYFAIATACTRMRAELGPPAHDLHNGGPDYILTAAFGTRAFGGQQLTLLTWFYWFNRAYRSIAMPYQLEAFKMGERKGISSRHIAAAIGLATLVGLLSGYWALYHMGYRYGVEARMAPHLYWFGNEAFSRLTGWMSSPKYTDIPAMLAVGLGLAGTLTLQAIRMRFAWWPIHPLGLAVSGSYSMNTIWLPLIIAWVCKVSILRYGGMKLYRQSLWFFLGLIVGDYVMGCAWPAVGYFIRANTYSFQQ